MKPAAAAAEAADCGIKNADSRAANMAAGLKE